jgi:hypothetical protein
MVEILGLGTALAAWIVVVGGGRVWARLDAAHLPTTQTLANLPKQLFIVEGLQTLLVPILLGATIALFAYYSRSRQDEGQRRREEEHRREEGRGNRGGLSSRGSEPP